MARNVERALFGNIAKTGKRMEINNEDIKKELVGKFVSTFNFDYIVETNIIFSLIHTLVI